MIQDASRPWPRRNPKYPSFPLRASRTETDATRRIDFGFDGPETSSDTNWLSLKFVIWNYEAGCHSCVGTGARGQKASSVFNLLVAVGMSTPNVYSDEIEYFCTRINSERKEICVSLHLYNDRGWAVATAELVKTIGADCVEGRPFENCERTRSVDLVTLTLSLGARST